MQPNSPVHWDIYDHKFRCKAALNPSLNWSLVDQQLWLMIFTTLPDILLQQYLLLSNGPYNWTSSGGAQGSFCRNFNMGLDVSVNHACTNTCATPVMANTLDPHVLLSIPSLPSMISEIQNMSTTFQNQNEIKEQPPISIPHLEAAFSGHPVQHFVSQLCSNFKFGVHIGFQGSGLQGFRGICQWLSLTQILFPQIWQQKFHLVKVSKGFMCLSTSGNYTQVEIRTGNS